jgi:hypothetical protein
VESNLFGRFGAGKNLDALFQGEGPLPHEIILDYMYGVAAYKCWKSNGIVSDIMRQRHVNQYTNIPQLVDSNDNDTGEDLGNTSDNFATADANGSVSEYIPGESSQEQDEPHASTLAVPTFPGSAGLDASDGTDVASNGGTVIASDGTASPGTASPLASPDVGSLASSQEQESSYVRPQPVKMIAASLHFIVMLMVICIRKMRLFWNYVLNYLEVFGLELALVFT